MTDRTAKQIGIAIVEFDGHYVVGTRQAGQALAGFSEFPGGKCQPGEVPEDCAARECLEETGLVVIPVRLLERTEHDYAHAAVELHFWLCRVDGVSDETRETIPPLTNEFQWKSVDELSDLTFPEANTGILNLLVQ
ncbi:MAG: (deoxy)nucleoside triphosphate pyrophosphohydrolase [Planctomycetales bacterium]|jgi:mutator protein MutT